MEEIRCEEVSGQLGAYRHSLVGHPKKGRIERHLFYCHACVDRLAILTANDPPVGKVSRLSLNKTNPIDVWTGWVKAMAP
jgi:hypothetical protein